MSHTFEQARNSVFRRSSSHAY